MPTQHPFNLTFISESYFFRLSSFIMEYQGFRVLLHLRLGIMLTLLAGITYCKHAPASFSELFRRHKYITEAYFQKHETLIDRAFQDFISSELSHVFCGKRNFMPKLSVMQRQLIGEGSHRRLTSSVKIEIQPEVISSLSCEAIAIERLPSGVFADPFELEHLTERGVFSGASAFGDTDLELPTVRANRSVVEVHVDLSPNSLSGNKNSWELKIEIPLHARYAPLGKHGYTRVEFESPDLFVHCVDEGDTLNQSCIFSSTDEGVRTSPHAIVWEVPSGIVKHTKIVSVLTFIAAVVGALSVFMACIFYSEVSVYNGTKQS
ncbi:putative glycosylphosphatidylinositol-mannosyltransferase I, PIG-X/PBN1 [Helianthus annuus]|nr:putative glycosylphosphatidylinositol-mannosyltransferase I, PIG-X/PBN1 [Helianthus annuus]